MSEIKSEDGKKWINAFIVLASVLVGFLFIRLFDQLGEWFDLEAKVGHFTLVSQGIGVLVGVATFAGIFKNKTAFGHLDEVYQELIKVIWPGRDEVVKATFGVVIGLVVISGIFVCVDFIFQKLLDLVY